MLDKKWGIQTDDVEVRGQQQQQQFVAKPAVATAAPVITSTPVVAHVVAPDPVLELIFNNEPFTTTTTVSTNTSAGAGGQGVSLFKQLNRDIQK